MTAAKGNRYGHRDATMIIMAYRHGLRAAELVDLQWSQVDFTAAVLHVRRVKKGTPATHPLRGVDPGRRCAGRCVHFSDTSTTGLNPLALAGCVLSIGQWNREQFRKSSMAATEQPPWGEGTMPS
jgi:Phage integrase family